ncbi:MAG TPA: PAS domain-containing sensor histidine kinase [Fluviicola sp.]|nr:PAS domain-containing sensor histidine kinase [Fluviicola sp.]
MNNSGKNKMEGQQGLDTLFQHATEGIIVTNDRGVIIRANPSTERLFGYETGELIGQSIELMIPKRYTETHVHNRKMYNKHPHARKMGLGLDLFARRKDDSEFPVEISLSPYKNDDGDFVIAFIVDITLRKQAEERLRNYSEELEKQVKGRTLVLEEAVFQLEKTKKELRIALEKEREVNEMKSRFVSMASHEFRTPLTTMMSSLSLVSKYAERNDMDNHSRHVQKIKKSINNLTDILNDFLSVSKLEEGKVVVSSETVNVEEFIGEVVHEMKGMSAEHHLSYTHSGDETAVFDPKLMRNILINLISNGIKFSHDNSEIVVHSEATATGISVSVSDKGIGIPQEDKKHLFERFFRGNNATHIQGTGLGLNIVARYAELMEGTISIESEQGKGTTVTLTIPAK